MKIAVCGSIGVSDKLIEVAETLEKNGHEVNLPYYTKKIKNGEMTLDEFNIAKDESGDTKFREMATEDLIKRYYRVIGESDAIVVVNTDKNGIKNYIGGNTLMELGFAYVLDKKIFLLSPIPEMSYTDEIVAVKPIVINNDLGEIK
ncbi:MAG: hypothetical protein WCG48_04040 [Candidatus Berkelbacteria bacterium]